MGRDVEIPHVPLDMLEEQMGEESQPMFEWFNESGYEADLAGHDIDATRLVVGIHDWDYRL